MLIDYCIDKYRFRTNSIYRARLILDGIGTNVFITLNIARHTDRPHISSLASPTNRTNWKEKSGKNSTKKAKTIFQQFLDFKIVSLCACVLPDCPIASPLSFGLA